MTKHILREIKNPRIYNRINIFSYCNNRGRKKEEEEKEKKDQLDQK